MRPWADRERHTRSLVAITAGLVILLALGGTAANRAIAAGRSLPDVSLFDWNGRPFRLADTRGKVVLVDFWASWCGGCKGALPALDRIARRHLDSGLTVLAVNIDTDAQKGERFLAQHLPASAMTLLRDPEGTVMSRLGAEGMPALFLVDREGRITLAEAAYPLERLEAVERAIVGLLAQRP